MNRIVSGPVVLDTAENCSTFLHKACLAANTIFESHDGLTEVVIRGDMTRVRAEATRDVYKGTFWFSYRVRSNEPTKDCAYTLSEIVDDRDPREPFSAGKEIEEQLEGMFKSLRDRMSTFYKVSFISAGISSEVHLQRRY